jgi:hypothetical protein
LIDELKMLKDNDVIKLCKALRRPGGMVPNPAGRGNPIPNPVINVPQRAVKNLKMAAYYSCHHPPGITLANVRTMRALKDHELAHEQPKELPTFKEKDMVRTMDAINSYLRSYLGKKKIPLAYVTREDKNVVPSVDDPAINYMTVEDEMIARAPPPTHTHGPYWCG